MSQVSVPGNFGPKPWELLGMTEEEYREAQAATGTRDGYNPHNTGDGVPKPGHMRDYYENNPDKLQEQRQRTLDAMRAQWKNTPSHKKRFDEPQFDENGVPVWGDAKDSIAKKLAKPFLKAAIAVVGGKGISSIAGHVLPNIPGFPKRGRIGVPIPGWPLPSPEGSGTTYEPKKPKQGSGGPKPDDSTELPEPPDDEGEDSEDDEDEGITPIPTDDKDGEKESGEDDGGDIDDTTDDDDTTNDDDIDREEDDDDEDIDGGTEDTDETEPTDDSDTEPGGDDEDDAEPGDDDDDEPEPTDDTEPTGTEPPPTTEPPDTTPTGEPEGDDMSINNILGDILQSVRQNVTTSIGSTAGSWIGDIFGPKDKKESGTEIGEKMKETLDAAYPGTNSWERLGSSTPIGQLDAATTSADAQRKSQQMAIMAQLANTQIQADSAQKVAKINERSNVQGQQIAAAPNMALVPATISELDARAGLHGDSGALARNQAKVAQYEGQHADKFFENRAFAEGERGRREGITADASQPLGTLGRNVGRGAQIGIDSILSGQLPKHTYRFNSDGQFEPAPDGTYWPSRAESLIDRIVQPPQWFQNLFKRMGGRSDSIKGE